MWKSLDSGCAKKSEVLTGAVINFSSGTESQVKKLVILPESENYARISMM
jgi:hypothetical protein